ncbi:Malonyl-CoA:anthocyanidin 5-O-glucoside-6''-O-malonyltransferase [Linum perenne]
MTTRVIEICHVAPSPPPAADFTLPLTFFDTFCLKFLPVEQIFFYRFPSSATSPIDVIIPRLKRSLSLALRHFLPIAGKLTWPEEAEIPFVLYKQNDTVSLTIAESTVDSFDLLSVPKLDVSGSNAAVLALQVTVFCQGFCVGVTCHHGVFDGKSYAMFLKAWAHISKEDLTEELTPFLDRTIVKDPDGIALEDVKTWMAMNSMKNNNPRSLELPTSTSTISNQVRGIFKLSRQDIDKLKVRVKRQLETNINSNDHEATRMDNVSTFVVSFAYTLICIAKAKGTDDYKVVKFGFSADCRSRLDPPLPSNYFGNCVMAFAAPTMKIEDVVDEGGIARVAREIIKVLISLYVFSFNNFNGLGNIILNHYTTSVGFSYYR